MPFFPSVVLCADAAGVLVAAEATAVSTGFDSVSAGLVSVTGVVVCVVVAAATSVFSAG